MAARSALRKVDREALLWIAGLLTLAVSRPDADRHYTVCPFRHVGLRRCPGCGLGRSISYLFRGRVRDSFQAHPLGVFALAVILGRIATLLKSSPPHRLS